MSQNYERSLFDPERPRTSRTPITNSAPPYEVPTARTALSTSHTNTSHTPGRTGSQRDVIWQYLRQCGNDGGTLWEIATERAMLLSSTSARLNELAGRYRKWPWQWIVDSGRTRPTPTGSDATVWVALDHGVEVRQL